MVVSSNLTQLAIMVLFKVWEVAATKTHLVQSSLFDLVSLRFRLLSMLG